MIITITIVHAQYPTPDWAWHLGSQFTYLVSFEHPTMGDY